MTDELKPCPFCSSKDVGVYYNTQSDHMYDWDFHVECYPCGACGEHDANREEAIAAWNRRTPAAPALQHDADQNARIVFVGGLCTPRNGGKRFAVIDRNLDSWELRECDIEMLYATSGPGAAPIESSKQKEIQRLQAKIDELMLEYCPDEMTPEQMAEWAKHQRVATVQPTYNGVAFRDLSADDKEKVNLGIFEEDPVEQPVHIDIGRMEASLNSGTIKAPNGMSREEKQTFIEDAGKVAEREALRKLLISVVPSKRKEQHRINFNMSDENEYGEHRAGFCADAKTASCDYWIRLPDFKGGPRC